MYGAKKVLHSVSETGRLLFQVELTFPRVILAEMNTHRMLSRNTASSRAIPFSAMMKMVRDNPYVPDWTKNHPGMQGQPLDKHMADLATQSWLHLLGEALKHAEYIANECEAHKQDVNRILEPWAWTTQIVSTTSIFNWFVLRDHHMAHPAMQKVMHEAVKVFNDSVPQALKTGEWALPYVTEEDVLSLINSGMHQQEVLQNLKMISAVRCARISTTKQNVIKTLADDWKTHATLVERAEGETNPIHASPLEHVAQAMADPNFRNSNFLGYHQYRKEFFNEYVPTPLYGSDQPREVHEGNPYLLAMRKVMDSVNIYDRI